LPKGYTGLSLGPRDSTGPPADCGMHSVNCWYVIS